MNSENLPSFIADLFPLAAAIFNFIAALIWGPKKVTSTITVLKQLFGESRQFLKVQWPFVLFCIIGMGVFDCQTAVNLEPEFLFSPTIALPIGAWLTLELSKMFYISHLASARHPGLAFSITLTRFLAYSMTDGVRCFAAFLSLLLVQPGMALIVRTCLFLPIFIIEKQTPLKAIQRSWSLTKDKYWFVSLYLGPIAILYFLISALNSFLSAQTSINYAALACTSVPTVILELVMAGMIFKLYMQLTEEADKANATTSSLDSRSESEPA